MIFIIDLTPKSDLNNFNWWINTISSMIEYGYQLIDNATSFSSLLRIAIITFDGYKISTYYNLNDPSISNYAQLSQILSLIQSLVPVADETSNSLFGILSISTYHNLYTF